MAPDVTSSSPPAPSPLLQAMMPIIGLMLTLWVAAALHLQPAAAPSVAAASASCQASTPAPTLSGLPPAGACAAYR